MDNNFNMQFLNQKPHIQVKADATLLENIVNDILIRYLNYAVWSISGYDYIKI